MGESVLLQPKLTPKLSPFSVSLIIGVKLHSVCRCKNENVPCFLSNLKFLEA